MPTVDGAPTVSIVVPCRNEAATISDLIAALQRQSYPAARTEVIVADGMSTDGTREAIVRAAAAAPHPRVRIVDNPELGVPSGLNRAIRAGTGEIIIRVDAHAIPRDDYVERSVAAILAGMGDNVGGTIEVRASGHGTIARAIASAVSHPMGVGDAAYRTGGRAGNVDTVPFGAFRRATLERVGLYDEALPVNQDYELNARIRAAGGVVWLDPAIRCIYFSRGTLRGLARQYWRYGFWKRRMLARHPGSLRWRQAVPPVFVTTMAGLSAAGLRIPSARRAAQMVAGAYLSATGAAALSLARGKRDPALAAVAPLAFWTMHFAWGSGFIASLFRGPHHVSAAPAIEGVVGVQ